MKTNKLVQKEAEYKLGDVETINWNDLDYLLKKASKLKRKRYRFCLHSNHKHPTQEMIICFKGFNYVQPHRHIGKRTESYHMIKGSMDVYLFENSGKVKEIIRLDANKNKKNSKFFYKLSKSIFHTILPRSKVTIYHEVLTGPFHEKYISYAKFAPKNKCSDKIALDFFKKCKKNFSEKNK